MSDQLEKLLLQTSKEPIAFQPRIFDLAMPLDQAEVEALLTERRIVCVRDDYEEQLKELFQIDHPTLVYTPDFSDAFGAYLDAARKQAPLSMQGRWVYYPWLACFVHILEEDSFQRVRTARNRHLITEEEQEQFYHSVVGIGGLSVGNSVALALVLQGGARHIRLADHDRLALTNTNRIRTGIDQLGEMKVHIAARQIYQINPYSTVEVFPDGLTLENIDRFFDGPPALDLIIDELDTIAIKYKIREMAHARRVPVIMGADNGDNAIIDIERHDMDPQPEFFHGRLGSVTYDELLHLDKFGIGRTITKMLGPENITVRMQNSLLQMGKTIVSWPQLGGAALLNGVALAYCARKILTGAPLESSRALVSLDALLDPAYHTPEETMKRAMSSEQFARILGV